MFILITLLLAALLGWALWFLIEFIRYTTSGEYELDQRLRDIQR